MAIIKDTLDALVHVTDPFGVTGKAADVAKPDKHRKLSEVLAGAGFTGAALITARQISIAESGGRPTAVNRNTNGTQDTGLMQINDVHCPPGTPIKQFREDMKDPDKNAKKGYEVSNGGTNFQPWVTFTNGRYKMSGNRDPLITTKQSADVSDVPVVGPVVDSADSIAGAVTDIVGALLSKDTWFRIGKGVVGLELLTLGFVGLVVIALKEPLKKVAKVAPVGRAAGAAKSVATTAAESVA